MLGTGSKPGRLRLSVIKAIVVSVAHLIVCTFTTWAILTTMSWTTWRRYVYRAIGNVIQSHTDQTGSFAPFSIAAGVDYKNGA
jgi:Na+/alanine symporter